MSRVACGLGPNGKGLEVEKMPILSALLASLCGYALSLLFFLTRTTTRRPRFVLLLFTGSLTLAAPLAIPAQFPIYRCLVATTLVFFIMKGWEVHLHPGKYANVSLRTYAPFLMNHCLTVPDHTGHFTDAHPLPRRVRHFLVTTLYITFATTALYRVFQHDWSPHSFWSEHFVKAAASFIWIDCAFPWYGALWHLAGFKIVKFNHRMWLADTPAQFWRRYHRPAYIWLRQDIFKPLRVLRSPGTALLLTFFLSGLIHEYILTVSLSRMTGHMLAFFTLQGLASWLTWPIHLKGAWKLVGLAATYAFLLTSAVYFFAPVNEGIAFYTNQIPTWISPW
jgi:hypothetical protein